MLSGTDFYDYFNYYSNSKKGSDHINNAIILMTSSEYEFHICPGENPYQVRYGRTPICTTKNAENFLSANFNITPPVECFTSMFVCDPYFDFFLFNSQKALKNHIKKIEKAKELFKINPNLSNNFKDLYKVL